MLVSPDTKYWVGFNLTPGIGPARLQKLLQRFGSVTEAWAAGTSGWYEAGLDRRAVEALAEAQKRLDLDREMEKAAVAGVNILTWSDSEYPRRLMDIPSSPPVIYVKGDLLAQDEVALAVVGTRKATRYALDATEHLCSGLAANNVTVVSGLAYGVDAAAHASAIKAGGRSLAVLGNGLDTMYPASHARLARSVSEHGALVSDYPLGTMPAAENFPPRNRIISGLSIAVLVVEGARSSGAMITADYALEQGKDVYAVPGSIFNPLSEGTHNLIKQGAKLVSCVEDMIEELHLSVTVQQLDMRTILPENETEGALLSALSDEPIHIDELGRKVGMPVSQVSSTLALMELKGMVRHAGGMSYTRAR